MAEPSIIELLKREHRRIHVRRIASRVSWIGFGFGVPAVLVGLLDMAIVFSEPMASYAIMACMGLAGAVCLLVLRTLITRTFTVKDVALKAETVMPELMDSLICACEMSESPETDTSPLHHALLDQVNNRVDRAALLKAARKGEPGKASVLVSWLVMAFILGVTHHMPIGVKFRDHMNDTLRGSSSAITVEPGDCEVAAGDELLVRARIHRGPLTPVQIELTSATGSCTFRMAEGDAATFEFTLFGLSDTTSYRVVTPTVTSASYTARVYRKPEFESIDLVITPPAYTGKPPSRVSKLGHMALFQGSRVQLTGKANMPVTATLSTEKGIPVSFNKEGSDSHTLGLTVSTSETYRITLEDGAGHRVTYKDLWDIEMVEDLPPVIKIIDPARETTVVHEGNDLPISAEITDDYGVQSAALHFNINGQGWRSLELRGKDDPALQLALIFNSLNLRDTVKLGDVCLFYIEATDHAEPGNNRSRSGIRFVEIRPKKSDDDSKSAKSGDGKKDGEPERLRVSDLIMRLKALIRDVLSVALIRNETDRNTALHALTGKAADLYLDTNKRYEKLKKKADSQNMGLGVIGDLFVVAVADLKSGYNMLEKPLVMEALSFHQSGLANLIKIELELEKNRKKPKGQGACKKGSTSKAGKGESKDQKNAQKQQRKQLEDARKMLEDLRELIQQQRMVRERMKELSNSSKEGRAAEQAYVTTQQKALADKAETLRDKVDATFPKAGEVSRDLARAKLQMQDAARNVAASQPGTAGKYAANAEQFLKRAKSGMERLRDSLTNTQLKQAVGKLNTLQKKQKQLQNATGQLAKRFAPDRQTSARLADGQKTLSAEYEELLEDLEKAGAEMEEQAPGSEERIQKAIHNTRDSQVAANMKRASNSLRYRRPEKALGHQKQVRAALKSLADRLDQIQQGKGTLTPEELSEMLAKTLKNIETIRNEKKMPPSENMKARKQMIRDLQKMAGRIGTKEMQQLSDHAEKIGSSGEGGKAGESLETLLGAAAGQLEKELLKAVLKQKIRFSRVKGQQAPGDYSKLVERYFKALSEDEDE